MDNNNNKKHDVLWPNLTQTIISAVVSEVAKWAYQYKTKYFFILCILFTSFHSCHCNAQISDHIYCNRNAIWLWQGFCCCWGFFSSFFFPKAKPLSTAKDTIQMKTIPFGCCILITNLVSH